MAVDRYVTNQGIEYAARKKVCMYCGATAKKHRRMWIYNTGFVLLTALSQTLIPYTVARLLRRAREYLARASIIFLQKKGIIRASSERSALRIPRAQALFDEAKDRGIYMRGYTLLEKSIDYYDARFGDGRTISFFGLPRPSEHRHRGERWMDDKSLLKTRLATAAIPVPRGGHFSNFYTLRRAFTKLTKPVVLKPRRGSRGSHTTTYIYSENDLYHAYTLAKQMCHFVVMEEHLHGPVYRGTVIDGKVVGILAGEPPRITGDGIHTIAELIETKNGAREPLVTEVRITLILMQFLMRSGHTLRSILPVGQTIDVSDKIGVRHGGISTECTTRAHPSLVQTLEDAAGVVDDPIIGFDFIIQDITQDPKKQRWGILEANSLPYIELHNEPRIGTNNNVAKYVWDLWN